MLYILTLTWNGCDKLSKLKNSLFPAINDVDYTWLIKDNASKDDTIAKIATWDGNIKCIPYKNNLQNFATGMNFLFNEAAPKDDDLILLLNNDVILQDTYSIKNMIKIIDRDKDVGVVGARLLYTDTNTIQHAGVVFENTYKLPTHFRTKEVSNIHDKKNRLFQVVTGAVLLTKAEYFKNSFTDNKSGNKGMDEKFHWAFDDVDLCLSINYNLKKKIVYCGETNIFHEESASLKKSPTNHLFMNHNVNYLRSKWAGRYQVDKDIYCNNVKHNLYEE